MAQMDDHKQNIANSYDVSQQPFNDAQPSMKANPNFNNDIALEQAKKLRAAMKGLGTNEKKIIEVTSQYNHQQRLIIRDIYVKEIQRDLIKDLKSELSGNFEKLLIPLWYNYGEFDARQVDKALDGIGFNTDLLNEIILTRTNKQLLAVQKEWGGNDNNKSLVKRVEDETKKFFSSQNNYQTLLLEVLKGNRPPSQHPGNKNEANKDAELLNRFLINEKESVAKQKFVEIFTTRSWLQLRLISNVFQDISKKYTLSAAISKAFGNNSDTAKALCLLEEFVCQPYDFFAKKIKKAMEGMGTKDDLLVRVVVSRAEIDLVNIGKVFGQRYGNGKTLFNWIKDDTSGDYQKLLLAVCGFN